MTKPTKDAQAALEQARAWTATLEAVAAGEAERAMLTEQNAALAAEQASIKAETARLESDQAATRTAWAQETADYAALLAEQEATRARVQQAVSGYVAQAERGRREIHQARRAEQPSGPVTVPESEGVRP